MITTYSLNKRAPVVDGSILHILGYNVPGVLLSIENQDTANTMVYHFESSIDGATWTPISLPIDTNGNTAINFTVLAGQATLLKLNPPSPHLRLMAHGDLPVSLSLIVYRISDMSTAEVLILES